MKNHNYLKVLILAIVLGVGFNFASAQVATMQQKIEHGQTLDDQYDLQKRRTTRSKETATNFVVSSNTQNGLKTIVVQLGYNLVDQADATFFANKIAAQPGVVGVSANHSDNRVTLTIKEEDEYDALKNYFNIQ